MSAITTVGDISRVHAAERPDKVALICDDRTWTYAELDRESNQAASALAAAGVGAGDRVAFLDKNAPEYFSFLIGAGADPTEQVLIAYCKENLAGYKCPTSIERMDAIPRNPSGKVLKTELRKPYWEGHDRMVN